MVASSLAMGMSMVLLAANVFFLQTSRLQEQHENRWIPLQLLETLPVIEIVAYMLSFGLGVGTVPWLLLGELCPTRVEGTASG
jgi:hypothetical protein